jgi:TatD DNase family protein
MLVDSHCHLDFPDLAGKLDEIQGRMSELDVRYAMCISVNLLAFPQVLALAENHGNLYATVGIHPDQKPEEPGASTTVEELCRLADHPRILAIGETGLDYHWHQDAPEWQRERFRTHIRAARAMGKPLVIHTREASVDTLRIMREERADEAGGVMHCFTESAEVAREAMDLGFYISFSGIITFKNASALREVVKSVPLERTLVETDSPFLAPAPHRGKTNEPGFTRYVAEEVARLKELSLDVVADVTTRNFQDLFKVRLNA